VFNPDHYIGIVIANTTLLYNYALFITKLFFHIFRHTGNAAFIAVMAANDGIGGDEYKKWAMTQINYILGELDQIILKVLEFSLFHLRL
jgi:hypothetical protein